MKKNFITALLTLSLVLNVIIAPQVANAQTCSSTDYVQRGALNGTIALTTEAEEPGDALAYDTAYLSDETWNELNPTETTTLNFGVSYTESTGFSGQAWSELFGWLNFDYGSSDQAVFTSVNENPDDWGGWTGEVNGLNDVSYGTNNAQFIGQAYSYNDVGVYVGLVLNFYKDESQVDFEDDSQCAEYVDLYINNTANLYKDTCPIATPTIKWTSQNIDSGTCVATGALWATTGSKSDTNTSGESAAGPVTESGTYATPQQIKLTCTGLSGNDVVGIARVSCGTCDPESDPDCVPPPPPPAKPIFKEV